MRRDLKKCWLVTAMYLASALATESLGRELAKVENNNKPQPNIIILLADDLGYGDLSSYGHPSIDTPALDRLAAEGQRWTDFYANAPVCSPSRGALMTGKLPVRSGLYGINNSVFWPNAKGGIRTEDRTLAEVLRGAGYHTAIVGKWHLGDKADALPTRHGFERWLGVPYSNDMNWVRAPDFQKILERMKNGELEAREIFQSFLHTRLDPNRKSEDWNVPLISSRSLPSGYADKTVERPAMQETLTRRYTEEAVAFIKEHANGAPFLLYVAYNMPHLPTFASQRFAGKSLRGSYGDAVEEIDWSVNEIRSALEKTGLATRTLVVFSSDNGAESSGEGGSSGLLKGGKGTTFEGGVRVPGIFWWPGRIQPGIVHGIGSLMDLYATAISVAGITPSGGQVDSIDLSPAFDGQPSPRTSFAYYSMGKILGYRSKAWKVSFSDDGFSIANKYKLHNLERDPAESKDVSESHPKVLSELIGEAKKLDASVARIEPIFDQ